MMEAGSSSSGLLLQLLRPFPPLSSKLTPPYPLVRRSSSVRASFVKNNVYKGPKPNKDLVADWVSTNDDTVRSLPIYVGAFSLLAVLFNRTLSGIAPVADASSSQSRADLLTLGLAVTNILTGLVWLSIRPKTISVVNPQGVECRRISADLPDVVVSELLWVWESLSDVTCSRSLVVVYQSSCILQIGIAAESSTDVNEASVVDTTRLMQGSLYQGLMKSGAQSYLANLSLYPGKSELPFLPRNTQAVILQPIGDRGVAIVGGDTVRGFTSADQNIRKGTYCPSKKTILLIEDVQEDHDGAEVRFTDCGLKDLLDCPKIKLDPYHDYKEDCYDLNRTFTMFAI